MVGSRFVVGIDLGTTNSALAYADTGAGDSPSIRVLPILQLVRAGDVAERPLLPSFLYLPKPGEQPVGSLALPWDAARDYAVGEFARNFGVQVPTRLVSSAKSWLCHPGVDRRSPILPWKAPEDVRKVSPLEASTRYLQHLRETWNHVVAKDVAEHRLEHQEVVLTVPASFDAAARDLTVEAARAAGLEHVTLLEEPQAAFYAWIQGSGDAWREKVEVGDVILVCDVGGGTTDLTLIAVAEEEGQLVLQRIAVGDHILLGGDNMDLALAHHLQQQFARQNVKLDTGQFLQLGHAARLAKEQLFGDSSLTSAPVTVLGRGSRVIGGALRTELTRQDLEHVLIEGFLPKCPSDAEPKRQRAVGLQELGLPYAADPAITKHLAAFLRTHAEVIAKTLAERRSGGAKAGRKGKSQSGGMPTAVLFNGGVFKAQVLQERLEAILNEWAADLSGEKVRVLPGNDLDLAVARGAAYYGLVRRGKGVRIRGGTARAYYVGVESSLPAVPGMPPPIKAVCVVPFGMEEGTEADIPGQEFGLIVGEPVQFRFLGSTQRRQDTVGTVVEDWQDQIEELNPLEITLDPGQSVEGRKVTTGMTVPVVLHSKVTPVGTLELWCRSRDGKQQWKLEFNVRERPQT
ncbi:MAG: Hsp70 family protein [Gemmatales bacterium]|nr:Hsp70 family protein [Gemmatales bacterium]MDW8387334.1 Hsp70 family protein [Gemmatales bacterium]